MVMLIDMYDDHGALRCRYCRFATFQKNGTLVCRIGDNPGLVNPDVAECAEGSKVGEDEEWERKNN